MLFLSVGQILLLYFQQAVIGISKLKHLKHRQVFNSSDAKCSANYLGAHCHLKYFPLFIVGS